MPLDKSIRGQGVWLLSLAAGILSVLGVAETSSAKDLYFQPTASRSEVRLVWNYPEPIDYQESADGVLTDTSGYQIVIVGQQATAATRTVHKPVGVKRKLFDLDRPQIRDSGLVFVLPPMIAVNDSLVVTLEVGDAVVQRLSLKSGTFGPAKASTDGVSGISPMGGFIDADVDLSRLDDPEGNGAIQHHVRLSSWLSEAFHFDLTADGITFLGATEGDSLSARPAGTLKFGLSSGFLKSSIDYLGSIDLTGELHFESATDTSAGTTTAGLAASIFPRFDRLVGEMARKSGGKTINFPPRIKFAAEYVNDEKDDNDLLRDFGWRYGIEADWRVELAEGFYVKLIWRYAKFEEAPIVGRNAKEFSYLDLTGGRQIKEDLYLFWRYAHGELAPIYESDYTVTTGFSYRFSGLK